MQITLYYRKVKCWGEDSNLQWVTPSAPKADASTNFATPACKALSKHTMFCYIFPNAPIAQLVEQLPLKETVPGSSPGRRTRIVEFSGAV